MAGYFDWQVAVDAAMLLSTRQTRKTKNENIIGKAGLINSQGTLTAFRLSASDTAELDRCRNKSIILVIGDLVTSALRTAVTVW